MVRRRRDGAAAGPAGATVTRVHGVTSLRVNGTVHEVPTLPDRTLLRILRSELGLTGTKYGCGEGECGACTVLVRGAAALACRLTLREVAGAEITTIEGLRGASGLTAVQRAFAEIGAYQCGYCTPGMVLRATAFLRERPEPTRAEIAEALNGNLCRCCGYGRILDAVERAAVRARENGEPL